MTYTANTSQLMGLAEIVASLPLSLTATDAAPQVVGLTGDPGWAVRSASAVADGALAVVVERPSVADLRDVDPATRARVVLAWDFAANPGVHAAAAAAEPRLSEAVLAQGMLSVPCGTDLPIALLDLLMAASRVFGGISTLTARYRDLVGVALTGRLVSGAPLTLSLVVTDAYPSALHLRLLTGSGELDTLVPSPATAAPAEVRIVDAQGERLLPTVWVSSRRASWQDAVAVAAGAMSNDITELQRVSGVAPEVWNR